MGKWRLKQTVLVVALGLMVAGCNETTEVSDEVYETPVAVEKATNGSLSGSNRITGEATPGSDISVMPKVAGEIIEVYVEKGQQVKKGQELARIDAEAQARALKQEEAALKQAQSSLQRAQNGLNQVEANYRQAVSSKNQAAASLKDAKQSKQNNIETINLELKNAENAWNEAKKALKRTEALFEDGLISQIEFEEAKSAEIRAKSAYEQVELSKRQAESGSLASPEASVEQAEISIELAKSNVRDAELSVQDANISVEQAHLNVEAARKNLTDYVIKAPATGELVSIDAAVGEMVSNQAAIARLITVDIVHTLVRIPAGQLMLFEVGDEVDVVFAGVEGERVGRVSYISPTSDDSGLFTVEVEVNNEDRTIRPGMVATLNIEQILVADSMIIPTTAVVERQDETYIFIIQDDVAIRQEIEVTRYDTEFTAVSGNVTTGDLVVVKGQNLLNDGDPVRIVEGAK
ncbi:efflux RND transporter periplasmic adaptor subunit [Bacillus solitudinis]|uniref:efflux RND transporter periplasmic adaptor subunit n=1 Tax=Bacillus solitudinis TaxID=2014074 RepID=UPI000C2448EB|nr:efflux RND transporter periplasmic adaptor subunit [Bacillus solitudinis]